MASIKPRILKGMRDFLPEDMRRRQFVFSTIETVFQRYGYEACQTPTMEYADILEGKYGEEERLIYRFEDQGGRRVALKYDLTVPLARLTAMYQHQLNMPFKRYQIQPVFRSEKPQKGRYREFYQCDVDIIGTTSPLADAELVVIANEALQELGFRTFTIRTNHRQLLRAIALWAGVPEANADAVAVSIDKLDKIGADGVRTEMANRGIAAQSADQILDLIQLQEQPNAMIAVLKDKLAGSELAQSALNDLHDLFQILDASAIAAENYAFDLTLARGLGYYTGPIFEIDVTEPRIGSLGGGGRYDGLIGMFMKQDIPACGISLGVERLVDVMTELDMFPDDMARTGVLVTVFDDSTMLYALKIANRLREAGINTEVFFKPGKLKKQFSYADKKGIQYSVVAGPDEMAQDQATLKNMKTGDQQQLSLEALVQHLRQINDH